MSDEPNTEPNTEPDTENEDPDAPGNFVDDDDSSSPIPEPNEPA